MFKKAVILSFICIPVLLQAQENKALTIDFQTPNFKDGTIYVALYNSKENFLKTPLKGFKIMVNDGNAQLNIDGLASGEYAVSSFYDKNSNGKLDMNFLGIPKEPIAISNNAKGFMGPPKYEDAKFNIHSDKTISIRFK